VESSTKIPFTFGFEFAVEISSPDFQFKNGSTRRILDTDFADAGVMEAVRQLGRHFFDRHWISYKLKIRMAELRWSPPTLQDPACFPLKVFRTAIFAV